MYVIKWMEVGSFQLSSRSSASYLITKLNNNFKGKLYLNY